MELAAKQTKDQNLQRMVLQAKTTAARLGMLNRKAEVTLVIDISASMRSYFSSGRVQEIVERMLAIALNFDPNGQIEVIAFGRNSHDCGVVTKENYHECVQFDGSYATINGKRLSLEGGTSYAPALDMAYKNAFGGNWQNLNNGGSRGFFGFGKSDGEGRPKLSSLIANPHLVLFVTDGDCGDAREAMALVDKGSNLPLFTQFAGFGSGFRTLDAIDNMQGRHVDNAGVFTASSLGITDQQLFDGMLNEFPDWLRATANEGWYQ